MKLIGYRFKSHADEEWAYTYDLDGVSHGKGVKEYGYVDPVYIDDEKNHIQVEIPKVPRWVADILSESQTINDYEYFGIKVAVRMEKIKKANEDTFQKFVNNGGRKKIDLAIALGVWEIEKK